MVQYVPRKEVKEHIKHENRDPIMDKKEHINRFVTHEGSEYGQIECECGSKAPQ